MTAGEQPRVGIIMGSDSDLPVMRDAATALDELAVPWEMTIVSAHRTPDRMIEYARGAAGRGLQVIIAGAGGAAHLPGMIASVGQATAQAGESPTSVRCAQKWHFSAMPSESLM